jgi:nucleoside-diphosphate-sugar epimerase
MKNLFVTGASGLLGGETLARLMAADPELRAYVLVRDPLRWPAQARARGIDAGRTHVLQGDVTAPDLGLDRWTRARVIATTDAVLHAAADTSFSQPLARARAVNVEGTRALLRLAASARNDVRFVFVSSAFVAGTRTGTILDGDGDGRGWVNAYEQSKAEAERLVRAYEGDWMILRPSTVVYDARRGCVPQINAVHRALRMCWHGLAPMLPGTADAPVDFVTSDYVAEAATALMLGPDVTRRTVHLCAGEGALSLGELLALCWRTWSRDEVWRRRSIEPPAFAPLATYRLFERTVREAGDERLRRIVASLSHFAPQLALPKRFDTTSADALLGFRAPAVATYLPRMLDSLLATTWTVRGSRRAA